MTLGGEVDAVRLHHSRRPDGIDHAVRLDGPDAPPVKFAQNLRHIGLPHVGANGATAMLAPLEIIPAEIQDHNPGAVGHGAVETRELSACGVSVYSGIGDMNVAAPGMEHTLQHRGPCFVRADASSLGIAGAKGNDLRRGGIGRDDENDEHRQQQPRPDGVHGVFLRVQFKPKSSRGPASCATTNAVIATFEALSSPFPPAREARGGEGSGVGGVSAYSHVSSLLKRPHP
jgi:hypothetical protein